MDSVLEGRIPALIIKGFYSKPDCKKLLDKIKKQKTSKSGSDNLDHLGPFLMKYTTNKTKYFQEAKKARQIFDVIFDEYKAQRKKFMERFKRYFQNSMFQLQMKTMMSIQDM